MWQLIVFKLMVQGFHIKTKVFRNEFSQILFIYGFSLLPTFPKKNKLFKILKNKKSIIS